MRRQDMKAQVLSEMAQLATDLSAKVDLLRALDCDGDDTSFDLHDQLTTFDKVVTDLQSVVSRATTVNGGQGPSLADILQDAIDRKELRGE